MFTITDLTTEYTRDAVGVRSAQPRFGWKVETTARDWKQRACHIVVATSPERLAAPDMWDSGELKTDDQQNHLYGGRPLEAGGMYVWQVTVTADDGEQITAQGRFEMGLGAGDFTARWIAQPAGRAGWAAYLRREFETSAEPVRARVYISALGAGELYLNGEKVGDRVFDPLQTHYNQTVPYTIYDVTDALRLGANVVGVLLGDGWFNQSRVWSNGGCSYGMPRLLLELRLWYADGRMETIGSDERFCCDYSPVTLHNVYAGETYDARLEQPGWCMPGFDDSGWKAAVPAPAPQGELTCFLMPPIRKTRRVTPVSRRPLHPKSNENVLVFDMGENFAGFVHLHIPPSAPGTEYVLRFAEDIDDCGNLWYASTGDFATCVLQQDRYIAKGDPAGEDWEPRFTYHGFRYVELSGLYRAWEEEDGKTFRPQDELVVGYAVNTDLQEAGSFSCSDERLNQLQTLTRRTILSNYHGFPEDCPVRERCGWLGDAQIVSEAAICNFDMAAAYEKYMQDIADMVTEYGNWMMITPGKRVCHRATPLWSSAQAVIPWNLYLYYGDRQILERAYPGMRALMESYEKESINYILQFGLGDWCPPGGNVRNPHRIPVEASSTAEFYHVAVLTAMTAQVLGLEEEAAAYRRTAEHIRHAYNDHFYDKQAHSYNTQGANGAALALGLCPAEDRQAVAADAARLLHEVCGGAMRTGIWGNKLLVPAMTEMGYGGDMLGMLFNPDKSSFATMMRDGATSVWEELDTPPRGESASSFNHPMQAGFTSWFYSHILGIRPREEAPGFRHFTVAPYVFGGITWAKGHYDSPYGRIAVSWETHKGGFVLDLTVPAGTTAYCRLDGAVPDAEWQVRQPSGKKSVAGKREKWEIVTPLTEDGCILLGAGVHRIQTMR